MRTTRPTRRHPRMVPLLVLLVLGALACSGSTAEVADVAATTLPIPGGSQEVWCTGGGPAVVLIGGIGDGASSAQWQQVQQRLAAGARVCRYDRPGTGASPAPVEGRGPDDLTGELDVVVEHAAAGDPVVLVAHSFGGYLARIYADRHPERVAGVVFVDALDPSVGLARGTGAGDLEAVAMAEEGLDLAAIEAAASSVTHLPGDPPVVVLTRGVGATSGWLDGQERLAALSADAVTTSVAGADHQIPSTAPDAVVTAVRTLTDGG